MTAPVLIAVALAGGAGSVCRVLLTTAIATRATSRAAAAAPAVATAIVNVTGAATLGALAGAGLHGDLRRIAATGFLGGFTTFSTWMLDAERAPTRTANALTLALPLVVGIASCAAARALA